MLAAVAIALIAAAVFGADQWTKALATSRLRENQTLVVMRRVRLRHVLNTRGGALSLARPQVAIAWLLILGAIVLTRVSGPGGEGFAIVGAGMLLGGVSGNAYDQIKRGGVVDFITIGSWPTFNLADVMLVCGCLALLTSLLLSL